MIHILNGDFLLNNFPDELTGRRIVMREALADGDVSGETPQEFYATRAAFVKESYGETSEHYFEKVVPMLEEISDIDQNNDVALWFEDDLFCQINLWYVLHILPKDVNAYLVRPPVHTPYGFAAFDQPGLIELYSHRIQLTGRSLLLQLWPAYRENNLNGLFEIARVLQDKYPFLQPAIQAHLDRIPTMGRPGKPVLVLRQIMDELQTEEFAPVFHEFTKRESIYGYGDTQVLRIFNELKSGGK